MLWIKVVQGEIDCLDNFSAMQGVGDKKNRLGTGQGILTDCYSEHVTEITDAVKVVHEALLVKLLFHRSC